MLNDVHPALLVVRFLEHTLSTSYIEFALRAVLFVIKGAFVFVSGFCAFACKVVVTAELLFDPEASELVLCVALLGFLNQVMGIIHVKRMLKERVLRVFIGGQDATISLREAVMMEFYLAKLTEKIWSVWGFQKALVLLLTLDDDDIQGLVVEELHWHKKKEEDKVLTEFR